MTHLQKKDNGQITFSHKIKNNFKILIILLLLNFLAGCASMQGRFSSYEKANLSVFADNTIAMLAKSDFGLQKDVLVLTREYYDYNSPAAIKAQTIIDEIERIFVNIIDYSLNIVTLSESDRTDAEKVKKYADHLETFKSRAMQKTDMSDEEFVEMLANIRKQENLLGAFREAQPLINSGMRYAAKLLFEMDALGWKIAQNMESRIDDDFTYAIDFVEGLEDQKLVILNGLKMLYRHQSGDRKAIKELRKNPWIRSKKALTNNKLDGSQIRAIEKQLLNHLNTLSDVYIQLSDEIEYYHRAHKELDTVYNVFLQDNAKARLLLVIWARAHQKMASGKIEPAKWFDISETPGLLLKVGASAL